MNKIFVAVPSVFPKQHEVFLDRIINFFKKDPKFKLVLDLQWFINKNKVKDFFESETHGIEKSDFVVAEISYPSTGVGFLIAYAILRKKRFFASIEMIYIKLSPLFLNLFLKIK